MKTPIIERLHLNANANKSKRSRQKRLICKYVMLKTFDIKHLKSKYIDGALSEQY